MPNKIHESSIMLPRHASALMAADRFAAEMHSQKYIIIIVDGPGIADRKLSYVSSFPKHDVAAICERVADTLK